MSSDPASREGAPHNARPTARTVCRLAVILAVTLACLSGSPSALAVPIDGIHNIQHVVVIMQENRSFDSYFGTFPGANGIPSGVCVPDRRTGSCVRPFHDVNDRNEGGPHNVRGAAEDIDGGRMDGFVNACGCEEVMGYHDAREIPNYWAYAQHFVLQDAMFESAGSWSLPEHLFLVSGWSAECPPGDTNPMDCVNSIAMHKPSGAAWTDITYLLHKAGVSWRYYVSRGTQPDCVSGEQHCAPERQEAVKIGWWNPLPSFTDVRQDGQLGNVTPIKSFYSDVRTPNSCGLSSVSWIVPAMGTSEHPPALVSHGQTYVIGLVNAIMGSPCWSSSAIFISWDDWGGLYDHVVPPAVDANGYGLRVPGLLISPYARAGTIDHQRLSHDAYLKFIEDLFLGGARLNPASDGRPDPRPDVREEAAGLGDLAGEFDFAQAPLAPLVLPPHPKPGPPSKPPG